MVRNYEKKRLKNYTSKQWESALHAVQNGVSVRQASKEFMIPRSTLRDYLSGKHARKIGRTTVLSHEQEELIAHALVYASECGWPCDRHDLATMVGEFCRLSKIKTPWKTIPGKDFCRGFEKRWQQLLSKRKAEVLTVKRAKSVAPENLDKFFDIVQDVYTKCGIDETHDGSRVFNLDETGLSTEQRLTNCFFRRGAKDVSLLSPTCGKAMYTLLVCGSAAGELMPPFILYKALHLYDTWCKGGPENTYFDITKSGWMESESFSRWFEKVSLLYLV